VVVVQDPKAGDYFGGVVAAPVFSEVMGHALRLGGIEPDAIDDQRARALDVTLVQDGDRS